MRAALICLEDEDSRKKSTREQPYPATEEKIRQLETSHALAIARQMRDGGKLAPLVVCARGSALERGAKECSIPFLPVSRSPKLMDIFRIWRWQKKHPWLQITSIGNASLAMGRKLAAMRNPETSQFNAIFFIRPPTPEKARELALMRHCLCGSWYVADKLAKIFESDAEKFSRRPMLTECQPGMDLQSFNFTAPRYVEGSGEHFVFGMAESLLPRSGALLVARAMAAIWQRTDLPTWEMRMFGAGPRFDEILQEARALGVASRLSILWEQPLAEVCGHCHAWIAPGANTEELPETLWAGFAAKLPVVCAQNRMHKDRLQFFGPNSALRVGENNPQDMARAMIGIMRDARLRHRMASMDEAGNDQIGMAAMASRVCENLESWLPTGQENKAESEN